MPTSANRSTGSSGHQEAQPRPEETPSQDATAKAVVWRLRRPLYRGIANAWPIRCYTNHNGEFPELPRGGSALLGWHPGPPGPGGASTGGWLVASGFYPPRVARTLNEHTANLRPPTEDITWFDSAYLQVRAKSLSLMLTRTALKTLVGTIGTNPPVRSLVQPRNTQGWLYWHTPVDHLSLWVYLSPPGVCHEQS